MTQPEQAPTSPSAAGRGVVTNAQMMAECKRLEPSFRMVRSTHPESGEMFVATMTADGKVTGLSMCVSPKVDVERTILETAIELLRKRNK